MFPPMPVSTLHGTSILAWVDDAFAFADINEHLLFKLMDFIFTMSISSSFGSDLFLG